MNLNKMTKDFFLTRDEEAILLGCLLGDGHIEKRGNSYRFKIRHCTKQKGYVEWKYQKLKRFCMTEPKIIANGKDGAYSAVYFNSRSGRFLEQYHTLFYEKVDRSPKKSNYQKKISPECVQFLPKNSLLLAVWFLDDGHCRTDCSGGRIATDCFSKTEVLSLQHYLFTNYKIRTTLVNFKTNKNQTTRHYLSILGKEGNFQLFTNLIKPIVEQIPCMVYKIKTKQE